MGDMLSPSSGRSRSPAPDREALSGLVTGRSFAQRLQRPNCDPVTASATPRAPLVTDAPLVATAGSNLRASVSPPNSVGLLRPGPLFSVVSDAQGAASTARRACPRLFAGLAVSLAVIGVRSED